MAENLVSQAQLAVQQQEQLGLPAVLLVPAPLRELLSRFLRRSIPQLKVVSHAEVPDSKVVKVTSLIGSKI
jgi:flagellar biosynthesis protein FlhA